MNRIPASRRRGAAALAAAVLACPFAVRGEEAASAPGSATPAAAWTFVQLPDDAAPFHGIVNADTAGGGPGAMLYPTGGLGVLGLLVGVATHAALNAGQRSSAETKAQAAADKVLDPYRDALAGIHLRDLQRDALARSAGAPGAQLRPLAEAPAGELVVQAAPAFSMTADSEALVLDEVVVIGHAASTDSPVTQTLRVVAAPRPEADPKAAWSADGGAALKSTATALMATSLDIALAQAKRPVDEAAPTRTLRYLQGGSEKMERGQLVDESCAYMVVRTLRGGLLVVPHRAGATLPAGCPAPAAAPARAPVAANGFDPSGGVPAAAPNAPAPAPAASASEG